MQKFSIEIQNLTTLISFQNKTKFQATQFYLNHFYLFLFISMKNIPVNILCLQEGFCCVNKKGAW